MRRLVTPPTFLAAAALLALSACNPEKTCPGDEVSCRGICTTLATDSQNCGACGNACATDHACASGTCVWSTAQNCGTLGRTCASGERCVTGDCIADLYVACFDTNEVREATSGLVATGVPIATDAGPLALAWVGDALFVANSTNGTVNELRFNPPTVRNAAKITIPAGTIGYSDLEFLTAANGLLYVSNAAASALDVLDPVGLRVVDEIPLGTGTNPAGIVVAGTKAYVAAWGTNEVLVVDVSASGTCKAIPCGSVTKRISVPTTYASTGGSPMPARLAAYGGKLYATLWNLNPSTFAPAGSGRLAVIDTTTDTRVTTAGSAPVDLGSGCVDPADIAVYGQKLYVTCGASQGTPPTISGAGIVPVDLSTGSPIVGTMYSTTAYAPGNIVFCGGTGFAGDRASGTVLRYDPAGNSVTAAQTLCSTGTFGAWAAAVACGL